MRGLKTNARHRRHGASGFSLLEMIMVVALTIVVTVVSVISLVPLLTAQHLTNGYNTTMSALRQARDNAISQRTAYSVAFGADGHGYTAITVAPTLTGVQGIQNTTIYQLPTDVAFAASAGLATVPTPDGFGSASNSVDFGYTSNGNAGGTTAYTIYFCPDGSAQTSANCSGPGTWDGGVVYLNGPVTYSGGVATGYIQNSRAISLFGATGRIHGWRLYPLGTGYQWLRQ